MGVVLDFYWSLVDGFIDATRNTTNLCQGGAIAYTSKELIRNLDRKLNLISLISTVKVVVIYRLTVGKRMR